MDDEENTARGGLGPPRVAPAPGAPVHRSTAPAGTPAKPSDPANPMPAARSPSDRPRTVGGHTARLNIAEEPVPPSYEAALGVRRAPEPAESAPRSAGGTMRIQLTPTLTGPPEPAAPEPPSPAIAPASAAAPPAAFDDGELPAWKSPLAVAVGLVFFAMGSMLGVAIDARLAARGRAPEAAHTAAASATASVAAPPPPPTPPATAPAPSATASAIPSAKPSAAAPPRGGATRPPSGKPVGKPGLIFHDP
jgi:hypothetical protein